MPYYEYRCNECRKSFTIKMSYEEHGRKKIKCPECGTRKVEQVITPVMAKTSKKS